MQGYLRTSLRVFVLDDHDIVRQGLRDLLAVHRDIRLVGDSHSAQQAIEVIPRLKPDVMVLDLRLQDGSGIDVCRAARAADTSIRGLLLTSAGDDEALSAAILAGADGYVIKLARSHHILEAVRRVGAGSPLLEPRLVTRGTQRLREAMREAQPPLTEHESTLLGYLLAGCTNHEIADRLEEPPEGLAGEISELIERVVSATHGPSPASRVGER